ncbi:MAG: hypothetical protein CVU68_10435 [Deltaproteobacteria bacterium HGW-Deltaproteobacteria-3]|nr:MAG: hypothetical protein CVU68_10435 [Deltaproteobacteria bacterium HGW-Deltaproteobacteria-3]
MVERRSERPVIGSDCAVGEKHHCKVVDPAGPFIAVALGLPLDHNPFGIGLVLDKDPAVKVRGEIVVPRGNDRTATGGRQIKGVRGASGGKPEVAVGVGGELAIGLVVEGEGPREGVDEARFVAVGVIVINARRFGAAGVGPLPCRLADFAEMVIAVGYSERIWR